jgi:hypothetical protein
VPSSSTVQEPAPPPGAATANTIDPDSVSMPIRVSAVVESQMAARAGGAAAAAEGAAVMSAAAAR